MTSHTTSYNNCNDLKRKITTLTGIIRGAFDFDKKPANLEHVIMKTMQILLTSNAIMPPATPR